MAGLMGQATVENEVESTFPFSPDASVKGVSRTPSAVAYKLMPRTRTSNLQLYVGVEFLDPISFEDSTGEDDEGHDPGGGEVGLGAKTSKSVVGKDLCRRDDGRTLRTGHHKGYTNLPFGKKFKILGRNFKQARSTPDSVEGKDAECEQGPAGEL